MSGTANPGRDRASRVPLILSVALNLILATLLVAGWPHRPAVDPAAPIVRQAVPAVSVAVANTNPPAIKTVPFTWRMVESDDYRHYIANLRANECPEWLIRDIIVADVEKLYGQRLADLAPAHFEPWANADQRRQQWHDRSAHVDQLLAEQQAVIKELLGYEFSAKASEIWNEEPIAAVLLGFLSDEKAVRVVALIQDMKDAGSRIRSEAGGIMLPADTAKLQQLLDGVRTDLGNLLTASESDELLVRLQTVKFAFDGNSLFDGVTMTGGELRVIMRSSESVEDVLRDIAFDDEPSKTEQQQRRLQFERDVANLLGPARFADFQRAQDGDYREALQFARDHHLPKAAAVKVFETRQAAEREAQQIQQDASLSTEQRVLAFQVIQQTARQTVAASLGAANQDYLKQNAAWLNGLVPTNAPPIPEGTP
jgi:hypothetical protein